ncbi:zf-BED domain-containing protein, partial [Tanacetum coccineum]
KYESYTSHFYPQSPLFKDTQRAKVFASDVGVLVFFYAYYQMVIAQGAMWVFKLYGGPWIFMNGILFVLTYLQHNHPSIPHYDSTEWSWIRGALSSVDRDVGFMIVNNKTDNHVVHHLFPAIPSYHAHEATEAIKPILGDYYKYDGTPILKAFWREMKGCLYVESDDYDNDDENKKTNGVYWFRKRQSEKVKIQNILKQNKLNSRKRKGVFTIEEVEQPFKRGTIFLASIDTSDISKTKEKVFAMLDDFVEKIGEEHVVQVVTDNAEIIKPLDFEKKIEEHKVTIAKGRKVVSFIYNRTRLICLLKKFSNGKELLRPGATRFAASYFILCRLYELKGALISMFASEEWENSNFAKSQAGKNIESIVLDNVLRMIDSDSPAMGFILDAMVNAKKEIKNMYKDVQSRYQSVLDIIDQRWENQLQKSLHVAGYYLNLQMQHNSEDVLFNKSTFYKCLETMCGDENLSKKIDLQLDLFKKSKGLFNYSTAKLTRKGKSPADWWDSFGDDTPELKQFALCVLSLTFKWKGRKRKEEDFDFEDVDFDDEWITEDNEDLTNVHENESTTHGDSGDDDFLEEAMRNQYGGNEQSREESSYVFDEGNEVDAMAQLEIID